MSRWGVALVALLAAHAALLLVALRQNFVVVDESGHVAAGLSHWQTDTLSAYRVNPPLVRMLAALPVLAARPATDYRRLEDVPGRRAEWYLARDFADANPGRYFDLVCLARLTIVGWSLLGGGLIYRWASDLYGPGGGFLSASLWCFGPTVLAFAQVVVPDVPSAVAALAAGYAFRGYLRRPSWGRAATAGVVLGVAEPTCRG